MSKIIILILLIFIVLSGCIEESKNIKSIDSINQSTEQANQSTDLMLKKSANLSSTTLHREENIPEIKVTSFSNIYMHENSENLINYIFSWDNVPGSESYKLRDYLRNDLGIDWVNNATIIKAADNNTIRVFTPTNSLELKLADDKNTILITPNQIQLKVKEENGKLYIFKIDESDYRIKTEYNITERYYAVYGLSIKNNGSRNLDFKLNDLNVRNADNIFNATFVPGDILSYSLEMEILSNLEKETKIEDTTLFPGQTINGSVAFQVNSLYNKSFLLMYNGTPIPSASFEKSIEALKTAENYNYSVIFGVPPYNENSEYDFYETDHVEVPNIWANWINQSIFGFFNKADSEAVAKSKPGSKSRAYIVYALKVIPERNITLFPVKISYSYTSKSNVFVGDLNRFLVVDSTGEELINASISPNIDKIAILKNQTYELHSGDGTYTPQMNLSNATIVRISFQHEYDGCLSIINQDVILDKEQNITVARTRCMCFQH